MNVIEPNLKPIPITHLNQTNPILLKKLLKIINHVTHKNTFTNNPKIKTFKTKFTSYYNAQFSINLSNNTKTISITLHTLNIKPNNEIIIPTNSFITTTETINWINTTPKLVNINPKTHLLTTNHIATTINPNTHYMIPIHLINSTVDLTPIIDLAQNAKLRMIKNTTQTHSTFHHNRHVNSITNINYFSFYPTKNLNN